MFNGIRVDLLGRLDSEHLGQLANYVPLSSGIFGEFLRRTGDVDVASRDKPVIGFDRTSGKARLQNASISMCPTSIGDRKLSTSSPLSFIKNSAMMARLVVSPGTN